MLFQRDFSGQRQRVLLVVLEIALRLPDREKQSLLARLCCSIPFELGGAFGRPPVSIPTAFICESAAVAFGERRSTYGSPMMDERHVKAVSEMGWDDFEKEVVGFVLADA